MFAWTFGKWSHAMSEIYWVSNEGVIQPEARGSHGAVVDIEFGKCVEVDSACLKTGCHWEIWELMFQSAFVTPSTSVQIVQRLKSMETCKRFIYCFGECACVCACVHKMAVPYRTYLYKPYEIFFVVVEPICVTMRYVDGQEMCQHHCIGIWKMWLQVGFKCATFNKYAVGEDAMSWTSADQALWLRIYTACVWICIRIWMWIWIYSDGHVRSTSKCTWNYTVLKFKWIILSSTCNILVTLYQHNLISYRF